MSTGGNIKVVVRCRPLNSREIARGDTSIVSMSGVSTTIEPPAVELGASSRGTERKPLSFSFDHSYWSAGKKSDPEYASQDTLYQDLGIGLLDHSFQGFNTCIFAYGQTGSGKSYSMMGYGVEKGIIPLVCEELFKRAEQAKSKIKEDDHYGYSVEVSYVEIYNEKVRDLLNPKNKGNLKVREHPSLGPYVEDLSKLVVSSYDDIMNLMDEGNKARTVAATQMNETSSRSHAVFTLVLTQKTYDKMTDMNMEKVSRISLVDLAGSERANSTGATGARLKEGANINKSLTTLGKVIAALASASAEPEKGKKKKKADEHIPFRDSDCLGGNSRTTMIAAIAPSSASYEETLSTLRYADQAKKIKTRAVVNEDPNAKMIRELKEELEMLRTRVTGGGATESLFDPSIPPEQQMVTYQTKEGGIRTVSKAALQDQMQESEKLLKSVNETWEQKIQKTEEARKERERALEELGITVDKAGVGVHTPKFSHLVNLSEDPLMSECLVYQLKPGRTTVGNVTSLTSPAIRLSGSQILDDHCAFSNENGVVTLEASPNSLTIVNGKRVLFNEPQQLRSGYRVILGDHHVFRFNNPEEVRQQRDRFNTSMRDSISASDLSGLGFGSPVTRPDSPDSLADQDAVVDWTFAKRELALAHLNGQDPGLNKLNDEDLDKLFDDLQKVRTLRRDKSRPDSRMSTNEDFWSDKGSVTRHLSSNFTEDTSIDPPSVTHSSSGNFRLNTSHGSNKEDRPWDGYQSQLSTLGETPSEADREDFEMERVHMKKAIHLMNQEMKRLKQLRSRGEVDATIEFEPQTFSARELRLVTKVLKRWRNLQTLQMAETILSDTIKIKEANIMSRSLGHLVSYNWFITDEGALSASRSALDAEVGIAGIDDDPSGEISRSPRPRVGVKVLDSEHNCVYIWPYDKFLQQYAQMKNVAELRENPTYSQHFSLKNPFHEMSPIEHSFIGSSLISLASLYRGISASNIHPIFCQYTSEAIGSCRISLNISSVQDQSIVSSALSSSASSHHSPALPPPIAVGNQVSFVLCIDDVKGPSSLDFSSLHSQCRLTSFTGPSIPVEDKYPSSAIDLNNRSPSHLSFRRQFSLMITSEILQHWREGYAPIEFFAIVKPGYLERLFNWDRAREREEQDDTRKTSQINLGLLSKDESVRRPKAESIHTQSYDISAYLTICEMDSLGDYSPVSVLSQSFLDLGAFYLQQGLQRRVKLRLSYNSGRKLPWVKVSSMSLGHVRLLDDKGQTIEFHQGSSIELKLDSDGTDSVECLPDGSSSLSVEGFWNSSLHNSSSLNRPTASNQRVVLRFTFSIEISTCEEPATFTQDIAVRILRRGASGPGFFDVGFFSSARLLSRSSSIFNLSLTPPTTRSANDLWRLDTSEAYVRGEEILPSDWKPRGVSIVQGRFRLMETEKNAADVRVIKALLTAYEEEPISRTLDSAQEVDLLRRSLGLWNKFGSKQRRMLNHHASDPSLSILAKYMDINDLVPKLVPQVTLLPRSDKVAKKGWLNILTDAPNNIWAKRYCILRGSYLHLYETAAAGDEASVISLASQTAEEGPSVVSSPEVEDLLGRKFAFTLFTSSNSYVLQAGSEKDKQSWRSTLERKY
ncbi:kinesin-like protein [Phaffia rhodozyma]|uniref:Kinesin-like protein n=1 Tax=Phaffia rhodozyma TaxID=264483 RepID=A0A0F7SJK2_PHARH|nr:kinesin-like protein [Phaffia rhodozyma]